MSKLAFGCSHTYGVGVQPDQAWPYLLNATNCGISGASSDLIVRLARPTIETHKPSLIYVLWPDWTRFEYIEQGIFNQSLPTDKNRIQFMERATDEWLQTNFNNQVQIFKSLCSEYNIKLIDITLYDLITYMDHADKWPRTSDNSHYDHTWHRQVADIFNGKA